MYWRNKNYANGQPAALYMLYEVYEGRVQLVETCCMQQRFNYIHSIYISSWQHCNILAWSHSLKNLRNLLFNVICVTTKLLTTAAPVSSPIYIDGSSTASQNNWFLCCDWLSRERVSAKTVLFCAAHSSAQLHHLFIEFIILIRQIKRFSVNVTL